MSSVFVAGWRCVLLGVALLWLFHASGEVVLPVLLHLYRWELGWLDDHYRVLFLGVTRRGEEEVLQLVVTLARPLVVGGQLILPDARGQATVSTLLGHPAQMAVLFLAALLGWPARRGGEYLLRALCGLPLLLLLLMADIPLVMLAELWAMLLEVHDPGGFSPLVLWSGFLQSGGRWALTLASAGMVIGLARRI